MTWSTGFWLAGGFLKLQKAHWSACQPLGQPWDETDKIIVSNEIQIATSVWTTTRSALLSLLCQFWRGCSILILNFQTDCGSRSLIQTRACIPASVELWYRLKFLERSWHHQPRWTLLSWQPQLSSFYGLVFTQEGSHYVLLDICISLGQVSKVREMNHNNMNTQQHANWTCWSTFWSTALTYALKDSRQFAVVFHCSQWRLHCLTNLTSLFKACYCTFALSTSKYSLPKKKQKKNSNALSAFSFSDFRESLY